MILDDGKYMESRIAHPTQKWFLRGMLFLVFFAGVFYLIMGSTELERNVHPGNSFSIEFITLLQITILFMLLFFICYYFASKHFKVPLKKSWSILHFWITFLFPFSQILILYTFEWYHPFFPEHLPIAKVFFNVFAGSLIILSVGQIIFLINIIRSVVLSFLVKKKN